MKAAWAAKLKSEKIKLKASCKLLKFFKSNCTSGGFLKLFLIYLYCLEGMEYNGYHILSKQATKIVVCRDRNRGKRLTLSQVCASSSLYLILFQKESKTSLFPGSGWYFFLHSNYGTRCGVKNHFFCVFSLLLNRRIC